MVINGFVLDPSQELLPDFKICPFNTIDLGKNKNLSESDLIDVHFKERFKGLDYIYTISGREAINKALTYYNLKKKDCVTLLTTTGNFYISSCVTKEIEKFCTWSRALEENTKIILVNHEFGYPFQDLIQLKKYNLPIIEDCAHSFFSNDKDDTIGTVGDFIIYSFPKMFPIQVGGLLLSNIPNRLKKGDQIGNETLSYIKNVLSHYIKDKEYIIRDRQSNYKFLKSKFETLGFQERFQADQGAVPGVFMFRTDKLKLNLLELKKHFYAHGVQCSVFYGEESFFIPVHQALKENDMVYFYEIMRSFIQRI